MRARNLFGAERFGSMLGRRIPLRPSGLGQPAGVPPTCAPNEKLTIKLVGLEQKWVCEPLAGAPPAPGAAPAPGGAPAPAGGTCSVPAGYEPAPGGGASSPDKVVYACPMPDGTYDVINARSFAPVLQGVPRTCLDQFGDVTMLTVDDAVCKGTPQTNPTAGQPTGACKLPTDKKFIMCPPSNGVTVNYFLDAKTAAYGPDFTTQSPDCANAPNVIKVGANSPYCGGSSVDGAGDSYPELVACFQGQVNNEPIANVHNGSDFALLASSVPIKDIPTRFPGKRWIMVTDMFCSALPDFGAAPVAPPTGPAPAPPPVAPAPPSGGGGGGGSIQVTPPPAGGGPFQTVPPPGPSGGQVVLSPAASKFQGACTMTAPALGQVRLRRGLF
jgi:hypothetical protein